MRDTACRGAGGLSLLTTKLFAAPVHYLIPELFELSGRRGRVRFRMSKRIPNQIREVSKVRLHLGRRA
jgi:hypothetical protein